ncbi:Canalicular multispecific organic anion transporter 1 [Tolypocladium paradoxum]|uniref:Canalicular multispecific organic anion transporter 1 n=1 Tax=Tolypocladium paradoxum TaxID=94208 RepID=A0A2S4KSG8_9HYPO|nr:Canalicular multispecific organic anion transporter 1 [Tolypocladium paradoxum]
MSSSVVSFVSNWFYDAITRTVDVQRPIDGRCPEEEDRRFGPTVRACRSQFDFTLFFEESILTIIPSAVFIVLALARIGALHRRRAVVRSGWLRNAKLGAATASIALRISVLVQQRLAHGTRTAASLPAAALAIAATLLAWVLSSHEHTRACCPSSLLLAYLSATTLFDVVKTRTYWMMPEQTAAGMSTANCVMTLLFFCLEARNKTFLLLETPNDKSSEELAGPINKSLYLWLNRLFRTGYKRALAVADLGPIDGLLYSKSISAMFQPLIRGEQAGIETGVGLIRLTVKCAGIHVLSPVIPRLALIAFTYSQSFVVNAMMQYLSDDSPTRHGYGLIGACLFVYVGIAVATSWYWRQVYRLMTIIRGGLVVTIFEKVTRLREDSDIESKATTLMVSDVQRIMGGVEYIHEVWASPLETGLATYLLYRLIGISSLTILGFGLAYSMMTLAPVLVFGTCLGLSGAAHVELDSAKMFSSLVLISLVSSPLLHVFQAFSAIGSAYGCYNRIHDFIQTVEPGRAVGPGNRSECLPEAFPNAEKGIAISLHNASFGWISEKPILHGIDLKVKRGSQVAIIGRTGSGKSLFMRSLTGEAEQLSGSTVVPKDKTAYCGQVPWLENVSAEENWTQHLANTNEAQWPTEVRHCCALDDIASLSDYRTGTIGSGGVRLSGGQRQRLALARAIAARKDVVLLDDVFSALDRTTRQLVSTRLLGPSGLLHRLGTTVIYTTHSKQIASFANEIYEIDDQGRLQPSTTQHLEEIHFREEVDGVTSSNTSSEKPTTGDSVEQRGAEAEPMDSQGAMSKLLSEETSSPSKAVSDRSVYMRYIRAMGFLNAGTFLILGIFFAFCFRFPHLWLEWWSTALTSGDTRGNGYWLGIFGMLEVLPLIIACIWITRRGKKRLANREHSFRHLMLAVVPESASNLHSGLLQAVLHAPFAYISRIDTGNLLNRFNQDLMFVDGFLPLSLFNTVSELFTSVFEMILVAIVAREALAVLPALGVVLYLIQHVYLRTSKQLRHMDLEWKGDLHTKFGETASGLATIRANGWVGTMRSKFEEKLDRSQEPFYLLYMVQRWLQLVLGLVVAGLAVAIAGVVVSLRDKVIAGAVGVAFLNVTTLGSSLTNFIVAWTSLEISLGAISRIALFERDTPSEKRDESSITMAVEENWPQYGHVRFENVFATYSTPEANVSKPVWNLRGITLEIPPGQKVAVCGRTGSGKSTLLLALMGMLEMPVGRIVVDGIDTSTIQMVPLRKRFNAISQDSVVDSSTFRQELDPEGQHTDEVIAARLKELGVWAKVSASGGLDGKRIDASLSNGETQLISIARLVLNASRMIGALVILDEATSSLDHETATKAEEILAERLQGKTIISVLHRLESAVKYDKIAVLDQGLLVDFGDAADVVARCELFSAHRQ